MADKKIERNTQPITEDDKEQEKSAKEQVEEIADKVKQETKEAEKKEAGENQESPEEENADDAAEETKEEAAEEEKEEAAEEKKEEEPKEEEEKEAEPEAEEPKEEEESKEEDEKKEKEPEEGEEKKEEAKEEDASAEEEKKEEESDEDRDETETEEQDEEGGKKKKKGFLFFGKGKKKKKGKGKTEEKEMTPEEVADTLEKQIRQARESEYLVLRIRKRTVLLLLGLALVGLWLTPVAKMAYSQYQAGELELDWMPESLSFIKKEIVQDEEVEPTPDPAGLQVRILTSEEYKDKAQAIANKLEEEQDAYVEVVIDEAPQADAVEIVVKPGDDGTRADLTNILATDYDLASPSAELTADSDFDAVILYGEPTQTEE